MSSSACALRLEQVAHDRGVLGDGVEGAGMAAEAADVGQPARDVAGSMSCGDASSGFTRRPESVWMNGPGSSTRGS